MFSPYGSIVKINCLHSFRTEIILKSSENVCKNHDKCQVKMPLVGNKKVKFNQDQKSIKILIFVYGDT